MSRTPYAQGTKVPAIRTRAEIEKLLIDCGATNYGYVMRDEGLTLEQIACKIDGIPMVWRVVRPEPEAFLMTPAGRKRTKDAAKKAATDEYRRRWRAVLLFIKAKIEMVESGAMTLEEAFISERLLPTGQTVAEAALAQIGLADIEGSSIELKLLPERTG